MCLAVDYCHCRCIAHRDIKTENFLVSRSGIRLIDFGMATIFNESENQMLSTYCGTLNFSAPEMLQRTPYRGPEVDIWSLGVVLYFLLSGRLPFCYKNVNHTWEKIVAGEFRFHLGVAWPEKAKELICSMLRSDPLSRPTIKEVMEHEWLRTGFNDSPSNNFEGEPLVDINYETMNKMVNFGWEKEKVCEYLETCKREKVLPRPYFDPLLHIYHMINDRTIDLVRSRRATEQLSRITHKPLVKTTSALASFFSGQDGTVVDFKEGEFCELITTPD
eukprot:Lithocolla_globosa_v1_NODE_2105_length_2166_cov_6.909522.p1 type:complete len:275 gc:universal NODE_2105_length_2166_cov_6.909522:998-174(-)